MEADRSSKPDSSNASRDRILDVAEDLFAERGFAATSMREIAGKVGVNVATLYYHCGSKDELFVSIYARVVERMGRWVGETFQSGADFRTVVVQLIDRVVAHMAEHPSIPRMLLRSDMGELPSVDKNKRQVYRPLYDLVARAMEGRAKSGEIRAIDPRAFLTAAQGVILYLALSVGRSVKGGRVDPQELAAAQRHARLFILGALGLAQAED